MCEQLKIRFVEFTNQIIDPEAIKSIPKYIAIRHKIMPIGDDGDTLTIAMAYPNNPVAIQEIRLASGAHQLAIVIASEDDIMSAIERYYTE